MSYRLKTASELAAYRDGLVAARARTPHLICLCAGSACRDHDAEGLAAAFAAAIEARALQDTVHLKTTGCLGLRECAPSVLIYPERIFYEKVRPEDVQEVLERTILGGETIDRLLYREPGSGLFPRIDDIPFFDDQSRLLLALHHRIDAHSVGDYIVERGYQALAVALSERSPEDVLDMICRSGLRERVGGGFPVGIKWRSFRQTAGRDPTRYLLTAADEGAPEYSIGCALLEGNPHSVIEGMAIGAYATGRRGSSQGLVRLRKGESPARDRLDTALAAARRLGLLGTDILGTGVDFDLTICDADETGGGPGLLHDAETWANIPLIVRRGPQWLAAIGTGDVSENPWRGSAGTKILHLSGAVRRRGLIEVPMGTSLRKIIFDIGGGVRHGRRLKAIRLGGAAGGCLPVAQIDLPLDFDRLIEAGIVMGGGRLVVLDESVCMVRVARDFSRVLAAECPADCQACREKLGDLHGLLDRICAGKGCEEDLNRLENLAVKSSDLERCVLGHSSPNPLLLTFRYFRQEYEEHVRRRLCRAGECRELAHAAA